LANNSYPPAVNLDIDFHGKGATEIYLIRLVRAGRQAPWAVRVVAESDAISSLRLKFDVIPLIRHLNNELLGKISASRRFTFLSQPKCWAEAHPTGVNKS